VRGGQETTANLVSRHHRGIHIGRGSGGVRAFPVVREEESRGPSKLAKRDGRGKEERPSRKIEAFRRSRWPAFVR